MSEVDFGAMVDGYDEAPVSEAELTRALPSGVYPFEVTGLLGKRLTKSNLPEVGVAVKVVEGPYKGTSFIQTMYLGASQFEGVKNAEGGYDQIRRSPEEYEKKKNGAFGRIKRFITSLGLEKQVPVSPPSSPDFVYEMFGFQDGLMVGCQFIDEVWVDNKTGRNRLKGASYSFDDAKNGIENWRREFLPKQNKSRGGNTTGASNGAGSGVGTI